MTEAEKMREEKEDITQEHCINKIFTALANEDEDAFWSAVRNLADLREEREDAVLFKLYAGLNTENWKLIKAQQELAK